MNKRCLVCNKTFVVTNNQTVCSIYCLSLRHIKKEHIKLCLNCKKPIDSRHKLSKYCSRSCVRGKPKIANCKYCNKEFTKSTTRNKYCSRVCSDMNQRDMMKQIRLDKKKRGE